MMIARATEQEMGLRRTKGCHVCLIGGGSESRAGRGQAVFARRAAEIGEGDLLDKIADETVATDAVALIEYMKRVGHPALSMTPTSPVCSQPSLSMVSAVAAAFSK